MNTKTDVDGNSPCYPALNVNPVANGMYQWGDVTVEISPDASEITIDQDGCKVCVRGSFFQDVVNVLNRCREETADEQSSAILLNTIQTSLLGS